MTDKFQIDQIKERTDIVETIGHYVKLQKKGQNFLGLCPFHREKSPSFTVSPEKNLWRCFGCGESGNVFGFLMKIENINFFDSLKILAGKAGITLEDSAYHRTAGPQKDNTYLYEILAVASIF